MSLSVLLWIGTGVLGASLLGAPWARGSRRRAPALVSSAPRAVTPAADPVPGPAPLGEGAPIAAPGPVLWATAQQWGLPLLLLDAMGVCVAATASAYAALGLEDGAQLLGRSWRTLVAPADQARLGAWLTASAAPGGGDDPIEPLAIVGGGTRRVAGRVHRLPAPPGEAPTATIALLLDPAAGAPRASRAGHELPCSSGQPCPYEQPLGTAAAQDRLTDSRRWLLAEFDHAIRPLVHRLWAIQDHLALQAETAAAPDPVSLMTSARQMREALAGLQTWMAPVLTYSSREALEPPVHAHAVPLQAILARVASLWQARQRQRAATGAHLPVPPLRLPLESPWVVTDPDSVIEMLLQLLLAAELASPVTGQIRMRLLHDPDGRHLWVGVHDDGATNTPEGLEVPDPIETGRRAPRHDPARALEPDLSLALPLALGLSRRLQADLHPCPIPERPG